ncbi:MAG: glucose-6-phosphate isomerase [Legionellales bacterium]|nr:glucose-6-phosphate isomerase [Legionellales bacterium]
MKLTDCWHQLATHYQHLKSQHMRDWFEQDPQRDQRFRLQAADLSLNYAHHRITTQTLEYLIQLAHAAALPNKIDHLFKGEPVNFTEQRPALHTALRRPTNQPLYYQGQDIMPAIADLHHRMATYCTRLRHQQWLGFNGQPITDIVHLGIGGSYLGPAMAYHALQAEAKCAVRIHFIANVDGHHLTSTLAPLDPATTLVIISSKSFTTSDTLLNAQTVLNWLGRSHIANQVIAITANPAGANALGIATDHILPIWDWVGGRYSLWSAIGLPLAISIGMSKFQQLLAGAHAMDQHFHSAAFANNMPVILGLLGIWYINFFHTQTHAVIPYAQRLEWLPNYLQQLEMESNGKQMQAMGQTTPYSTAPVIWGSVGVNGQHAFHQLLHQGAHLIPVDFIIAEQCTSPLTEHHRQLKANCISQIKALMLGNDPSILAQQLQQQGYDLAQATQLAQHQWLPGNKPSSLITLPQLTPTTLGSLIALYEHKVFVQSVIWQINCFDQYGVELGKQLTRQLLDDESLFASIGLSID